MSTAILVASMGLYMADIAAASQAEGVDPVLLAVVCHYESGGNPGARGVLGEVGLCQVRPETARVLGFRGPVIRLFSVAVNVKLAARWLAHCKRLIYKEYRVARLTQMAHCYNEGRFTATSKTQYSQRVANAVTVITMEAAMRPRLVLR